MFLRGFETPSILAAEEVREGAEKGFGEKKCFCETKPISYFWDRTPLPTMTSCTYCKAVSAQVTFLAQQYV